MIVERIHYLLRLLHTLHYVYKCNVGTYTYGTLRRRIVYVYVGVRMREYE